MNKKVASACYTRECQKEMSTMHKTQRMSITTVHRNCKHIDNNLKV